MFAYIHTNSVEGWVEKFALLTSVSDPGCFLVRNVDGPLYSIIWRFGFCCRIPIRVVKVCVEFDSLEIDIEFQSGKNIA